MLANEWDTAKLQEWGLDIPAPIDVDMEDFFDNHGVRKGQADGQFQIEHHEGTREQVVFNLLGL